MADKAIKLKPCPFCGGEARVNSAYGDIMWGACVQFKACGPRVHYPINPRENLKELAAETWNRRAGE